MNIFNKKIFGLLLPVMMFAATHVFAAEIFLDSKSREFSKNEEFAVEVFLNTEGRSLNAAEGEIIFPADILDAKDIRDGNSSVNFWIEKPHISRPGAISFSGITPGGLSGSRIFLFSAVFFAKGGGEGFIKADRARILQNDGNGTEVSVKTTEFSLSVSESGAGAPRAETAEDREPPEDFIPVIASDKNIFEGKNFLVFAAQDKGSGIDNYKVREGWWGWYRTAESPYLLKYQSLDRKITVKAIDKAGNERVEVLEPQHPAPWYRRGPIFAIIIVMLFAGFLFKKLWPGFLR